MQIEKSNSINYLRIKVLTAFVLVALLIPFSQAQDQPQTLQNEWKTLPFSPYFGTQDINHIALDATGFLWIAHNHGLARFDGYNYINFNTQNTNGFLLQDTVSAIKSHNALLFISGVTNQSATFCPHTFLITSQSKVKDSAHYNPESTHNPLTKTQDSLELLAFFKQNKGLKRHGIQHSIGIEIAYILYHPLGIPFTKTTQGVWYKPQTPNWENPAPVKHQISERLTEQESETTPFTLGSTQNNADHHGVRSKHKDLSADFSPSFTALTYENNGIKYHVNLQNNEVLLPNKSYNNWIQLHISDLAFFEHMPYNIAYATPRDKAIQINNKSVIGLFNDGQPEQWIELIYSSLTGKEKKIRFNLLTDLPFYNRPNMGLFNVLISLMLALLLMPIMVLAIQYRKKNQSRKYLYIKLRHQIGAYIYNAMNYGLQLQKTKSYSEQIESGVLNEIFKASRSLEIFIETILKRHYSLKEVIESLESFLKEQFKYSSINGSIASASDKSKKIPSSLVRDMKLMIFELSNNALKYSGAKNFNILIHSNGNKITIIVKDDGKLTEIKSIFYKGNGVSNIQKRAEKNGGTASFYINSQVGHGLLCKITLKC